MRDIRLPESLDFNRPSMPDTELSQAFFSISEAANRWRCSRGTVYNRLRAAGATVLDFAKRGRRGKKVIPASVVLEIERHYLRRLN